MGLPNDEQLLGDLDKEDYSTISTKPSFFNKKNLLKFGVIIAASLFVGMVIGMLCAFALTGNKRSYSTSNQYDTLNNCDVYSSFSCKSRTQTEMDEKFFNHRWNTPARGEENWKPGFQDMSTLAGYPQLKYGAGMKTCTVNVIIKSSHSLDLTYYFDGIAQKSNSKSFDSSYNKVLKIKVVASTGETLELPDVDFAWNAAPIKQRQNDAKYRNGQKGAIVELFGWPDDDIAQECKHIAEAGYLGVKIFPHQEQLMSFQPYEWEMNPWYFMYQPVSYKLDGRMGTRNQLRNMINTCRSYGLRVYADAVVNHMTGNGNDLSNHRNPGAQCTKWGNKTSSLFELGSPFYTPAYTYEINPRTGKGTDVLEFPGVPYGPEDFHCDKPCDSWADPTVLSSGWLVGLSDLDTSKEYVRQRIADFMVDLISIGFSGYRIDAAKHIHPTDLAAIFQKVKAGLGGKLPDDFISWLEVLTGGEAPLLVELDGEYSFTTGLTRKLKQNGLTDDEILKIKIWWADYPNNPYTDRGALDNRRKVIQNDDHDQQNDGSSSRNMYNDGCVLVRGCDSNSHRNFEVKLFRNPVGTSNNKDDFPIRCVLSSYYFLNSGAHGIPDGLSSCSKCTETCNGCKDRPYAKAYDPNARAYPGGTGYTYVHRDQEIINAMNYWMNL